MFKRLIKNFPYFFCYYNTFGETENIKISLKNLFPLLNKQDLFSIQLEDYKSQNNINTIYLSKNKDILYLLEEEFKQEDIEKILEIIFNLYIERKILLYSGKMHGGNKIEKLPPIVKNTIFYKKTKLPFLYHGESIKSISNIVIDISKKEHVLFKKKLYFSKKEKQIMKELIEKHQQIKKLWIIYKNFDHLYKNDFIVFNPVNGKKISKKKFQEIFLHMLIIYILEEFYAFSY